MPDSVVDHLDSEMECESLLECFFGLTELDRAVYGVLAEGGEAMTVDQVAAEVDRERSTAYRSVQRLVDAGFVQKEQINYDHGGYYHVFEPVDPDEAADRLQRMLNDWYAKMGGLIREFREKYGDAPPTVAGD